MHLLFLITPTTCTQRPLNHFMMGWENLARWYFIDIWKYTRCSKYNYSRDEYTSHCIHPCSSLTSNENQYDPYTRRIDFCRLRWFQSDPRPKRKFARMSLLRANAEFATSPLSNVPYDHNPLRLQSLHFESAYLRDGFQSYKRRRHAESQMDLELDLEEVTESSKNHKNEIGGGKGKKKDHKDESKWLLYFVENFQYSKSKNTIFSKFLILPLILNDWSENLMRLAMRRMRLIARQNRKTPIKRRKQMLGRKAIRVTPRIMRKRNPAKRTKLIGLFKKFLVCLWVLVAKLIILVGSHESLNDIYSREAIVCLLIKTEFLTIIL